MMLSTSTRMFWVMLYLFTNNITPSLLLYIRQFHLLFFFCLQVFKINHGLHNNQCQHSCKNSSELRNRRCVIQNERFKSKSVSILVIKFFLAVNIPLCSSFRHTFMYSPVCPFHNLHFLDDQGFHLSVWFRILARKTVVSKIIQFSITQELQIKPIYLPTRCQAVHN